jgi:ribosomal protein S14
MSQYSQYLTNCVQCGAKTSKSYARAHAGTCKACTTGEAKSDSHGPKCPQCGSPISAYKHAHHYVCESCVRENDPIGYANEVRGMYDAPDYY